VPALIEMSIYAKDGSTGDPRIDVQDRHLIFLSISLYVLSRN